MITDIPAISDTPKTSDASGTPVTVQPPALLFNIAGLPVKIQGDQMLATLKKLTGFASFTIPQTDGPDIAPEYTILSGCNIERIYNTINSVRPAAPALLHQFDFENIDCYFYALPRENTPAYQFEMIPRNGDAPFLLRYQPGNRTIETTPPSSATQLRFGLWMAYGLLAVRHNRIAIHASTIVYSSTGTTGEKTRKAILFLGESGTGKSTHTRLWREHIPGCFLLNDDSPILQSEAATHTSLVHGSPWSGKTPCYKNESCEVAAMVRLSQAPYNKMRKLSKLESIGALLPSCPPSFAYDKHLLDCMVRTLSGILSQTPVYHLECLPDKEAVYTVLRGIEADMY